MKHNKPKKKCRGQISESENEREDGKDDDDLSDEKLNENPITDIWKQGKKRKRDTKKDANMDEKKKKQNTNKIHDALVERDHGSPCRMTAELFHWLQNKDRVVLNHYSIHLCDHVLMESVFLDDRNEITTKKASFSVNARMKNRFIIKNNIRMRKKEKPSLRW